MDDSTRDTACRLLKVAYQQRVKRAGVECLAPRDVAPFIGLERFCEEVDEAIEYLERQRYVTESEDATNLTGRTVYQVTPEGLEVIRG